MDAATVDPDRILRLLRKQCSLYEQLQHLSHRQRGLIVGDQPEQLLSILHDRQSLVNALAQINRQLSPLRSDWTRVFQALPQTVREEVTGLLEQINVMLHAILKTDQEDGALLSTRKHSVGQELGRMGDARAAGAAYARNRRFGGDAPGGPA